VHKAYGDKRSVAWFEVFAGERRRTNSTTGCLMTPLLRSRNLAWGHQGTVDNAGRRRHSQPECDIAPDFRPLLLRQTGSYFPGTPSPVVAPEKLNVVIYRENTEDVYAGSSIQPVRQKRKKLIALIEDSGKTVRPDSGHRHQPISKTGSQRLSGGQ